MRLWSLHPKYLDPQGLVALWREALLAQAVLQGLTRGYKAHPQLERFRSQRDAVAAIGSYLEAVCAEARARDYTFDRSKIVIGKPHKPIAVTAGQVQYEWQHLLGKLSRRSPENWQRWRAVQTPECHPLFQVTAGDVESWERPNGSG